MRLSSGGPALGAALLFVLSTGCNDPGFRATTILPVHGWADGCTSVKVSGHGFEDDVAVNIGGTALSGLSQPDATEDAANNRGFQIFGVTPPAASSDGGFATVSVTTAGKTSEIANAFYYVPCPAAANPEFIGASDGSDVASAGATMVMAGCNLSDAYTVRVGPNTDDNAVTSTCSTAEATFTAPSNADGTWYVGIFDAQGAQLYPDPACDITLAPGTNDPGDDTGWTDPCDGAFTLTYGGAK